MMLHLKNTSRREKLQKLATPHHEARSREPGERERERERERAKQGTIQLILERDRDRLWLNLMYSTTKDDATDRESSLLSDPS